MSFTLPQSLGSTQSWQETDQGVSGVTPNARWRVLVYLPSLIRITITREMDFDDFSYAVVSEPSATGFSIHEEDKSIWVRTETLHLRIDKDPTRFTYLTPTGEVINADDPAFGTSWNGDQVTTYKTLQKKERFIGLGEKTGALNKAGAGFVNWNTDSFGYSTGADPLYCSTPFYIGMHHQLAYGIFFDNSHKSFFNFGASNNRFSSFAADAGEMDYYFFHGNGVAEIIQSYSWLTGKMPLPPLWSLGYQQCRYSYYPDKEVMSVARTFREKQIPADTMVLDIHYMDKYKIFTWDKERFPDPAEMIRQLKAMGFRIVVMCDPGIKVEKGYAAYDEGIKDDVFIKYPDGTNYSGEVWPGWCHFPDFTKPETRSWWGTHFNSYVKMGVAGFWNDMNEIATWGQMLPEDIQLDLEGRKCSMRRARNLYGMQMARSTYEGAKKTLKNKRPFVLTRSGYSGVQRYSAVWTGDNVSYDEHMLLGIRMVSNLGLAGIPFAGYDVGGFVGDAGIKLFARWYSIGAFSPFFRGHTMINSRDAEPWTYGEEVEQICRNYGSFRYRLLPYIYAVFHEASTTGLPVQRSLSIHFPWDEHIYSNSYQNQYLFGPSILVVPAESGAAYVKAYLPAGTWYYLYDGKRYEGLQETILECPVQRLPVFVRGGSILPMQQPVQHTGEQPTSCEFHVYKDAESNSQFDFYADDGESYDFEKGVFYRRSIELTQEALTFRKREGTMRSPYRSCTVIFHGFEAFEKILLNGRKHVVESAMVTFFPALEKFDPFYDPEPAKKEEVQTIALDFADEEIKISW